MKICLCNLHEDFVWVIYMKICLGNLHEDLSTFVNISCSDHLRMRNNFDKICTEILNNILCSITFSRRSIRLWDVWKNMVKPDRPQITV